MKKLLILAAAALVASVACTKVENEVSPDVEIGFQVATYLNQTKAHTGHTDFREELSELGIAAANYHFQSIAYVHAAQDGSIANPAPYFLAGTESADHDNWIETIKYNGSNTWKPAHAYYWPKSPKSSVTFFSWFDYKDATVTPDLDGFATNGAAVTLAWPDRLVYLKDNVMYADAAYHYTQNANGDDNHKISGTSEGVPTLFHHALAKVRFQVKQNPMKKEDADNSGNFTFWKVKLYGVSLSSGSIQTTGSFSITEDPADNYATAQGTWTLPTNLIWTLPADEGDRTTINVANVLGSHAGDGIFDTDVARGINSSSVSVYLRNEYDYLTGENYMANNYFAVMPQAIDNSVLLTFKYVIEAYYGTEAEFEAGTAKNLYTEVVNVNDFGPAGQAISGIDYDGTRAIYTDNGIQINQLYQGDTTTPIDKWQMNHTYTYKLIINPETTLIKYDPAVGAWDDVESEEYITEEPAA